MNPIRFSRSQSQLCVYTGHEKGFQIYWKDAVNAFGEDFCHFTLKNEVSVLICHPEEPARSLKRRMEEWNLSELDISDYLGFDLELVQSILNPKHRNPMNHIAEVAKILGLDPIDIGYREIKIDENIKSLAHIFNAKEKFQLISILSLQEKLLTKTRETKFREIKLIDYSVFTHIKTPTHQSLVADWHKLHWVNDTDESDRKLYPFLTHRTDLETSRSLSHLLTIWKLLPTEYIKSELGQNIHNSIHLKSIFKDIEASSLYTNLLSSIKSNFSVDSWSQDLKSAVYYLYMNLKKSDYHKDNTNEMQTDFSKDETDKESEQKNKNFTDSTY